MKHPCETNRPCDEAVETLLAGLRTSGPPAGMERRILAALRAADRDNALHAAGLANSSWRRWHSAWLKPAQRPFAPGSVAFAVALAAIFAVGLALPSFYSTHRFNHTLTHAKTDTPPAISETAASANTAQLLFHNPQRATPARTSVRRTRPRRRPAPLAVSEMLAASRPAPPLPLTQEEKLLLRVIRRSAPAELALLNPEARARQEAESKAEFRKFFNSSPGENE